MGGGGHAHWLRAGLPFSPSGCPTAPRLSSQAHTLHGPIGIHRDPIGTPMVHRDPNVPTWLGSRLLGTARPCLVSGCSVKHHTGPCVAGAFGALGCYQRGDNAETARR